MKSILSTLFILLLLTSLVLSKNNSEIQNEEEEEGHFLSERDGEIIEPSSEE